jgi:hypothetical protein
MDPDFKTLENRLQISVTYELNEWTKECWTYTFYSLDNEDKSLWKMTKGVIRISTLSTPLQVPREVAVPWSTALTLIFSPSEPALAEILYQEVRAYRYAPASEQKISPSDILQATRLRARLVFRTGS